MKGLLVRTVVKGGRDEDEPNEDSVAMDPTTGRFAVSDGAGTSPRSEVWSRILAQEYVRTARIPDPKGLTELHARWRELTHDEGLPWYALQKLDEGPAATLIGVTVDWRTGDFTSTAIGDACLLQCRGTDLITSTPLCHPGDFTSHPPLLLGRHHGSTPTPVNAHGRLTAGDRLMLTTDALAQHVLDAYVSRPSDVLPFWTAFTTADTTFRDYVTARRAEDLMVNDDVTAVVLRW